MQATIEEPKAWHEWPRFVLWFRPFKLDRHRAWRQVATAATERGAWEKRKAEQGEFLVLSEGQEP
jgi:hypothetical protein